MGGSQYRLPLLVEWYERYLSDRNTGDFATIIRQRYSATTLERIAQNGDRQARRAAVLGLGLIADYSSNAVLGTALVDEDRGVRTLAESSISNVWRRVGDRLQQRALRKILAHNRGQRYHEAIEMSTRLIHECPWIAEAWCQRGTAHFHLRELDAAIRDCHQALEINPYHFTAAAGIGQCYLLKNNIPAALEAFRRALRLNPSMEEVRAEVVRLQRSCKDE